MDHNGLVDRNMRCISKQCSVIFILMNIQISYICVFNIYIYIIIIIINNKIHL